MNNSSNQSLYFGNNEYTFANIRIVIFQVILFIGIQVRMCVQDAGGGGMFILQTFIFTIARRRYLWEALEFFALQSAWLAFKDHWPHVLHDPAERRLILLRY